MARRPGNALWQQSLLGVLTAAALAACGGADSGEADAANPGQSEADVQASQVQCRDLQWWNSAFTYVHLVGGWWDTDLAVSGSTAIQLRHPSKLIAENVYGWGWMPTFVDTVTGREFRFLHLRPQHRFTRRIGHV